MNLKHINTAIEVMEEVRDRKLPFDIEVYQGFVCETERPPKKTLAQVESCGTACCFSGYMAVHPKVKRQGGKVGHRGQLLYGDDPDSTSGGMNLARYLGITRAEADNLIYNYNYPVMIVKPKHVLEKLYALRERAQQELLSA